MHPKIIVDSREANTAKEIVKELRSLGALVEIKLLTVGDYIVSESIAVERKTVQDLVFTLIKRDLFGQLFSLKMTYQRPILLIEGCLDYINKFSNININSISGALASISRNGITIIPSMNKKITAKLLFFMARQEQVQENKIPSLRIIKKTKEISEAQMELIGSLPLIGEERAKTILKVYKTPLNALINFRNWKKRIRGIGEETIKKVEKILLTEYKE